jgi:hypothetical protein
MESVDSKIQGAPRSVCVRVEAESSGGFSRRSRAGVLPGISARSRRCRLQDSMKLRGFGGSLASLMDGIL